MMEWNKLVPFLPLGLKLGVAPPPPPHRLSCLAVCLALVKGCAQFYSSLPSFYAIVRPLRALLMEHLAGCSHPPELQVRPPPRGPVRQLGTPTSGEQVSR